MEDLNEVASVSGFNTGTEDGEKYKDNDDVHFVVDSGSSFQCGSRNEEGNTTADLHEFLDEVLDSSKEVLNTSEVMENICSDPEFSIFPKKQLSSCDSVEKNVCGESSSNSGDSFQPPSGKSLQYDRSKIKEKIDELINGSEVFPSIDDYMEKIKKVEFHLIGNSVKQQIDDTILIWLVELRNLISSSGHKKKSYITRLVFDPRQRSIITVQDGKVIGGICFRMFHTQNFTEINFVAAPDDQDYANHLMNHFKDYNIKHNIHNLLAYVSKEEFAYFEKQGFSSKVTLPESVFKGYLNVMNVRKEDSLIECKLDEIITYTLLPIIFIRQKEIIKSALRNYERSQSEPLQMETE